MVPDGKMRSRPELHRVRTWEKVDRRERRESRGDGARWASGAVDDGDGDGDGVPGKGEDGRRRES